MDGYLAEIRLFAGNFAPRNWAICSGQIMPIQQNTALFSLLGCTYGGDCRTTFAIPNLSGFIPVGSGYGPGLSPRNLGQLFGTERVTLDTSSIPSHTHSASLTEPGFTGTVKPQASSGGRGVTTTNTPVNNFPAPSPDGTNIYADTANAEMGETSVTVTPNPAQPGSVHINPAGGSEGHDNIQPSLVLNYIICINGLFPSRN